MNFTINKNFDFIQKQKEIRFINSYKIKKQDNKFKK